MNNLLFIQKSILFLLTFLLFTSTNNLSGQASYDNNGVTGGGQKDITIPAGHNRLLVVHAGTFGGGRSATFRGQSMTEIVSRAASGWIGRTTIWVLPLGSGCEITGQIKVFNSGGGPAKKLWAGSFQHVNQTTPVSDHGSAALPGGILTAVINGLTNVANMDIILDGLMVGDNGCNPPAPSALLGGTLLYNASFSSNCARSAARLKTGPGGNASVLWSVARGWSKPHVAIVISGITAINTPIIDSEAPTANCQDITVDLDGAGNGSTSANQVDNGSTDNCSIASKSLSTTSFTCSDLGTNPVTLTVVDPNNNQNTCSAIVTVENNNPPQASCQNVTVQLNSNGEGATTATAVNNGSMATCSTPSLSLNISSFNCTDVGGNSITLTATDTGNNLTATCLATVTVVDNLAPTANCQPFTIQLNANGEGSITTANVDNNSNDACGIGNLSLNKTAFNCSNVGSGNTVVLTVTDNNTNTATCSTTVTVTDNIPPNALCKDVTIQLDANGNGSIDASDINNGSNDACGIASTAVNPSTFNCQQLNNTVTLTVTDNNSNSSTCTATISTEDNISPTAICQNAKVQLDANGNGSITATEIDNGSNDNCAITAASVIPSSFNCSNTGNNTVTLTVSDNNSNSSACIAIVLVEDNINPQPVCLNPTVKFNGEAEITLQIDQVWDEINSTDNCGIVSFIGMSSEILTCDQLGSTIPVLVTTEDASGNPASCTAMVTVDGLPCGWKIDPAGINCGDSSEADFDSGANVFSLTSEGCYDPNYYSNTDSHGFVNRTLCGDGEIVAQITGVTGNGWAGISMREGVGASDKMIQLSIDGSFLTKREMRMTPGGLAFNHQFQTQGKNWLKLTRTGDTFGAYHSLDGINWAPVIITNILMSDCIKIGLFTENTAPTGSLTASFSNVSIGSGGNTLSAPVVNPLDEVLSNDRPEVQVYPNPSTGEVFINLAKYSERETNVRVFNGNGQLLETLNIKAVEVPTQRLELDQYQNGLYMIQIQAEGLETVTKKLTIMK